MLIKREVLEKIKFKFDKNKKAFDDILFCLDAKDLGYELFVDSNIINVEHLHIPWDKNI